MDTSSSRGVRMILTVAQVAVAGIVGAQIGKISTGGDVTGWITMILAVVALVLVFRARRAVRRWEPVPSRTSEDA